MNARWVYAGAIVALFAMLVVGVPLFADALALPVVGRFNLGMLIYLVLLVAAPALAFLYLRQRREDP